MKHTCVIFLMLAVLVSSTPEVNQAGNFLWIIPYDFECVNDLFGNFFSLTVLTTLKLCIVDSLWRYTVNPLVKPWIRSKSDEIYSYLAYGQSQMAQPFPHSADQLYTEGMTVIKT